MELRWVLLGFGILIVLGVYLWGRGVLRLGAKAPATAARTEPTMESDSGEADADDNEPLDEMEPVEMELEDAESERPSLETTVHKVSINAPEKVVALRLVPRGEAPSGEETVLALRKSGLEHGRMGIFHRIADRDADNPLYSIASLTAPGSFDLTKLNESTVPGLTVFMVLPGRGDPVQRFDSMLETARDLAHELNAEMFDEKGSSWSVQRERFIREEVIRYRHQLEHG